jgi:polyhydroxyalkanoate synthesis regulator phasin
VQHVDRLNKEKAVLACQVNSLLDMLVDKNVLSADEKRKLNDALKTQIEVVKKTELAENELKDPSAEALSTELAQELTSLGVVPDAVTIADTLDSDFEEVLQKVLRAFRESPGQGGGEAGNVAEV